MTAVVLLSRSTTLASLETTAHALAEQTRTPDRTVVLVPTGLPAELQEAARRLADRFGADGVRSLSDSIGQAGAVREALTWIDRTTDSTEGSAPARDEGGSPGPGGAEGTAGRAGGHEPTGGHESTGGRRARKVDQAALERSRTQHAANLSHVPERLRTPRRRTGRRAGMSSGDDSWLWFLTEQTAPGREALAEQLATVTASPTTAVVGPKRLRLQEDAADSDEPDARTADDADVLVDVGLTLTHSGRIVTGVEPGEIDQGQADWRQDVLAVGLPGMLIRERTLREAGGLDADLPAPWAEIDLCHRVWRGGERVAVQSAARALAPTPDASLAQRLQDRRTGQVLLLIKHRPVLLAILTLLFTPVATLLRTAVAVAASQPRRIPGELRATIEILRRAPRVMRRGAQERRRSRVPGRRLAPLYLPRGEGVRQGLEGFLTHLFADDDRTRRARFTSWGIAGTRHGIDDADYGRHITWTVAVAVLATALGMVTLRGLFGRGELSGPALIPLPGSWGALQEAAWSSWIPGGLGERGPADPLVRLLGHLPVNGSMFVEAIVFIAVPASALLAWWAAGAITRAVGARLVLAVTWAVAPPMLAALIDGAWPLLLVHMLLPLVALCIGRAVGLPHKERWASVPAAAAAGLLLLVIGAVTPALVLLAAVALALIAPSVPGRRLRLLWVMVPALALHVPYLAVYIGDPRLLLGVGGVRPQAPTAATGDLLALWPTAPGLRSTLETLTGPGWAQLLLMLPLIPVLVGAVIAPFLAGDAGRVGRFAALLAAAATAAVLLGAHTMTAVAGGALTTAPLHALLSAVLLVLCIGASAVFDSLARREGGVSRTRRVLTSGTGAVVAAICLVAVAGWTVVLPGSLRIERVEGGEVPAAAADQGRTDARARVLVLRPEQDGAVSADVVVHGEDSVIQHAAIASLRDVDRVRAGEAVDADPGSESLRQAVTGILAPTGEAGAVNSLALAYVIVPGDPQESAGLVETLDASTAVEKVTQNSGGGMWRVIDATARVRIDGPDTSQALPSDVIGASAPIEAADSTRTVVLSERADSQWRASVGGEALEPVTVDGWAQGFTVPPGSEGRLEIEREQPWLPLWQAMLATATALTVLIAIPWRGRSRLGEEPHV